MTRACQTSLRWRTDARITADLLVPKTVRRTLKRADVQTVRLRPSWETGHDDSVARLPRFRSDADGGELPAIVDLEPPGLCLPFRVRHIHHQEWMRVDEAK